MLVRFWGWSENKREEEKDFAELSLRAKEGKALYGESDQPEWVQGSAFRNSVWTQLKFSAYWHPYRDVCFTDHVFPHLTSSMTPRTGAIPMYVRFTPRVITVTDDPFP